MIYNCIQHHYCAYMEIRKDADDILSLPYPCEYYNDVNVHGEVTYVDRVFPNGVQAKDGYIIIGWDYGHTEDVCDLICSDRGTINVTIDTVFDDLKDAIDRYNREEMRYER